MSDNEKELEKITGVVERIVFQNRENGYSVIELQTGEAEYETIFGTLPYVAEGEVIEAYGAFVTSNKYGRQFRVESYEKQLPQSEDMMIKYLSSGTIRGIGPIMAKKIVSRFGIQTFDVIENNPEWLADINGISAEKARKIGEQFQEQHGLRNVMLFCRDFFTPSVSVRAYKKWGTSAVEIIRRDPYVLCEENFGVSFDKADTAAHTMGLAPDCAERLYAGIKYILSHNADQNGHTYLPQDKLVPAASQLLGVDAEKVGDALDRLTLTGVCERRKYGGRSCVFLKKYYDAEQYICSKLRMLQNSSVICDEGNIERSIDLCETQENIKYAPMQRKAIKKAVNSGVTVITGGPGTGKTTIIRAVTRIVSRLGLRYALAAPTGRAAKRISEAVSEEAKTIHRLLEVSFTEGDCQRFIRCRSNLLTEDVIIIDEASMIDVLLMAALLEAIKPGAKLLLIGDADQLPSVGAGNVLADIIASDTVDTIQLKEIFRQSEKSLIVTNAHDINEGRYPDLQSKSSDFFFLPRASDEETAETVARLCSVRLPNKYGEEILESLQVITPTRMGCCGVEALNVRLQSVLNPPSPSKKEKHAHGVVFREGDKVMQIKNDYDILWEKDGAEGAGIFNGDIGKILKVENMAERLVIDFDGRLTEYDYTLLDELEHAYAVTVHKSQGSEYKTVIIPAFRFSKRLLTRNLLYTAVTRAQQMVIIVGDSQAIYDMVDNDRHALRYTSLCERLTDFS
ncbi:MAG: ATP-dependent RecD-like DNA helicase [Clostridia bacterium]|nr:ATP-dependent RecD-like DNA helicase [Clostridia bacterium]